MYRMPTRTTENGVMVFVLMEFECADARNGLLKRHFLRIALNRGCIPHNVTRTILKTKNALREAMVGSVGFECMYDRMVLEAY